MLNYLVKMGLLDKCYDFGMVRKNGSGTLEEEKIRKAEKQFVDVSIEFAALPSTLDSTRPRHSPRL